MNRKPAIGIGIAAIAAGLCLAALASDSARIEKPAAVDAEQYADFIENEVFDIQDLADGAEIQRRMFNRITPPGVTWIQPMFPPVVPFDAENFDEKFLDELLGDDKNSVAIYPLSLALDPKTRETLIYNAEGKLIAAIPADRVSREWPEDADPARVTLQLDLLPSEDVEPYLFTESRIADYEKARASKATKSAGMVLRSLGASEFGIAGVQRLTNGNMEITVTNGTDAAEVFAYTVWHTSSVSVVVWTNEFDDFLTNSHTAWHPVAPSFDGIESEWECLTTNLVLSGGVGVYEDANISSNARVRFYAVANRLDSDGDGLTDGAEIFIHRTDPENPDTDGDGLSDYEEVQLGTEPNSPNIVKKMYFVDELPEEPARRSSSEGDLYVTWSNLQGKAIYTARLKEGYGEYTSSNITASIPPKYYLTKERIYHTECTGVRTNPYPNDAVGTMQFIMSQSNYCRKAYDPLGWPSSPIDHTCFGYSDFSRIFYSDCYNIVEMV